ncbi:MAG: diguanylate cyclase [Planctomycetota bacterium]|nr:MAG: diguanylate cyclase [Planctomycetota bacterium]
MRKRKPLSLRQTLWLSIGLTVSSTILGASALYGLQIYRSGRRAERLRVKAIAETYAIQIKPLLLVGIKSELIRFIEEQNWHPDTCLMAVYDSLNKPIAVRGHSSLLDKYSELLVSERRQNQVWVRHISAVREQKLPDLTLAAVPIMAADSEEPAGTLVCATRFSKELDETTGEVGSFFSRLILISATGMILGILWLNKKVIEPLTQLTRRSKTVRQKSKEVSLYADRDDEIGDLARVLTDMSLDIDAWRDRVERLERSVDNRVAAETEKIIRKLQETQEKNWTDPVTKLGNRLLLEEKFADIFSSQREANHDLSVVMIGIGNFDSINDHLGSNTGDKVLKFVGELLKQHTRNQDLAVRCENVDFAVILPSVPVQDAQVIAGRIIRMFNQQTKLLAIEPKPTMTAGIASLRENNPASADELLQMVKAALHRAGNINGSQVTVYQTDYQAASVGE